MLDQITIVIPTHQRQEPLRRCLESLASQSYPKDRFQIIVIPTEGDIGFEVVEKFKNDSGLNIMASFVPDDAWKGRSPALKRNYGAELAQTDWIGFIDDDCVADPDWLKNAQLLFDDKLGGIEGHTLIPPIDPPTLTYRGIQRLSAPGGYQTCNIFYRKKAFLEAGGFDLKFPFYLEDTDLAWSVLESGHPITFGEEVKVSHPVPSPQPWRLLDVAKRVVLMPYLYKKHPETYKASNFVILRKSYLVYLALWSFVFAAIATQNALWVGSSLALLTTAVAANSAKLFWGCKVEMNEFLVTTFLLPFVPVISVVQLIRGNIKQGTLLLGIRL